MFTDSADRPSSPPRSETQAREIESLSRRLWTMSVITPVVMYLLILAVIITSKLFFHMEEFDPARAFWIMVLGVIVPMSAYLPMVSHFATLDTKYRRRTGRRPRPRAALFSLLGGVVIASFATVMAVF